MYDQSLEQLIDAVIEDGVITDQERKVVYKKAASLGIDQDEIEVYLEGRLQKAQKNAAPKSGKHGVLKTCPNCGAPVVAGMAKCPDCGFIYTGIEATNSAKLLDERLRAVRGTDYEADEQRANIIRSFPIPNSREDLIEFLSALEPKALIVITKKSKVSEKDKKLTQIYYEKFMECLNKARISFPDDEATKMFEGRLKSFKIRKYLKKYFKIGIIVIILFIMIISNLVDNHNDTILENEYYEWVADKKTEIEAYEVEMNAKLDEIPVPNSKNWNECAKLWDAAKWTSKWDIPSKYKSLWVPTPDAEALERFKEKKNRIGKAIREAHKQALIATGVDKFDADRQTQNEFEE